MTCEGREVVELYTGQLVTVVEELFYGKFCGSKRKDSGRITS
jgi:hypothetical protein